MRRWHRRRRRCCHHCWPCQPAPPPAAQRAGTCTPRCGASGGHSGRSAGSTGRADERAAVTLGSHAAPVRLSLSRLNCSLPAARARSHPCVPSSLAPSRPHSLTCSQQRARTSCPIARFSATSLSICGYRKQGSGHGELLLQLLSSARERRRSVPPPGGPSFSRNRTCHAAHLSSVRNRVVPAVQEQLGPAPAHAPQVGPVRRHASIRAPQPHAGPDVARHHPAAPAGRGAGRNHILNRGRAGGDGGRIHHQGCYGAWQAGIPAGWDVHEARQLSGGESARQRGSRRNPAGVEAQRSRESNHRMSRTAT